MYIPKVRVGAAARAGQGLNRFLSGCALTRNFASLPRDEPGGGALLKDSRPLGGNGGQEGRFGALTPWPEAKELNSLLLRYGGLRDSDLVFSGQVVQRREAEVLHLFNLERGRLVVSILWSAAGDL